MDEPRPPAATRTRSQVLSWGLWDVGATGVNAIVVTFVFSVYLTGTVGDDLPSATTPQSWLFRALAAVGSRGGAAGAGHRDLGRRAVATTPRAGLLTGLVVLLTSAMSLIRDDYHYLWPGLVLLAGAAACSELSTVPYNAMLRQLSTPQTSGRISGFGFGMGYFGSVLLLLDRLCRVHIRRWRHPRAAGPAGRRRPECARGDADGRRVVHLVRAARVRRGAPSAASARGPAASAVGFFGAYRKLWAEVVGEWRRDHNIVYYLLASAVFRDGLTGRVRVRRGAWRQRVRHLGRQRAAVRRQRECHRRRRCAARRAASTTGWDPSRVIVGSLTAMIVVALVPDDAVRTRRLLGLRATAVSVRSGRRSRRRER